MKKLVSLLLSVVFVFSLVACSNQGSSGTDEGSDSGGDGKVTLRIAWWGNSVRADYTKKVIEMYEKQNPNVTIQPEFASWEDYWKKLSPQAAAGNLPDIIQMDISYLSQYGKNGQLADLQKFVDNGTIDTSNISQSAVAGGMLDGKLYGFNLGNNALAVVTDYKKLESIGVDLQKEWTWDDMMRMSKKIKDELGIYSFSRMEPYVFFNYYLRTQGLQLYGEDGESLGYEDDKHFVEFFGMIDELAEAEAVVPPDVNAQVKGIEDAPIIKDNAVFEWGWSNFYRAYNEAAKRPLGLQPLPGPNAEKGLFLKPSMYFSVSKNSKVKGEAAKFIDFFVNNVEANKIIMGDRGVPVSSKVKEALMPLLDETQKSVFEYVTWAEEHSSKMSPPAPLGSAEINAALTDLTEQIKFGEIEPEEAAEKFRAEAQSIFKRN